MAFEQGKAVAYLEQIHGFDVGYCKDREQEMLKIHITTQKLLLIRDITMTRTSIA
jgi:hypothetical protein